MTNPKGILGLADTELEIAYLKAKYENEGVDTTHIDWTLAIEYEKNKQTLKGE